MKFSSLVQRIGGGGVDAWKIHTQARDAAERGEDIIVLSVGDPEFATASSVVDAAIQALRDGDTHYTTPAGRPELRSRIASLHTRLSGQETHADNVAVVNGTQNGLFCAAQCVCEAGDEVLVPEPMYLTYEATIRATGARLIAVPVLEGSDFRVDLAAMARAVTPRTRAIFFATPCNPTGVVMRQDELQGIADIARRHDLWVVADEVYASLCFESPHISIGSLPGMAQRTVTVNSFSKSHAMAGWRCGWVIAPAELTAHIGNLVLCMLYGAPGFIQQAACTALDQFDALTSATRETYRLRRDLSHQLLKDVPGLRCLLPQAGMFMLVDVRGTGLSANTFAWGLLRETGVSVLDGQAFGPSAAGFVRLGFVVPQDRLREACSRIARYARGIASASARPAAARN